MSWIWELLIIFDTLFVGAVIFVIYFELRMERDISHEIEFSNWFEDFEDFAKEKYEDKKAETAEKKKRRPAKEKS